MNLIGDGTWGQVYPSGVSTDGDDIVARNVEGTRWGGSDDSQDGGQSASGLKTSEHPDYIGVSLPIRVSTQSSALLAAIGGSPIPKIPWYTPVKVYSHKAQKFVFGHLIDIGPAKYTGHGIDMTNALVEALGLSLSDGVYLVDFRIIGGAKYVTNS